MKPVSTDLIHAELIRASIDEIIRLRAENARLREALKGWQDWWKLPWQDRRPDIANVRYMKALKAMGETE